MKDITVLLEDAAEPARALDLERVHRDGARRRRTARGGLVAIALLALVVGSVAIVVRSSGDGNTRVVAPGSTESSVPTTTSPTTTTTPPTTTAPTTTVPPVTTAPTPAGLTAASKLGYAGLGPILLGMDLDAAIAAAQIPLAEPTGCAQGLGGPPLVGSDSIGLWATGHTIDTIEVYDPSISTISGIHVGSTRDEVLAAYPTADATGLPDSIWITNPEQRTIQFSLSDDTVVAMILSVNRQTIEQHAAC
jgi:hypothetical protein